MRVHRFLLLLLLGLATGACASASESSQNVVRFAPTPDPVTRLFEYDSPRVLQTAAATLREIGFEIEGPAPGATWVFSDPITIQTKWRGAPVADRIVCGLGTAIGSDPIRLRSLANTVPVDLRLGYEIEPRQGSTAMKLLFHAEGRRSGAPHFAPPTMSCTVTNEFVDELFEAVEQTLRTS